MNFFLLTKKNNKIPNKKTNKLLKKFILKKKCTNVEYIPKAIKPKKTLVILSDSILKEIILPKPDIETIKKVKLKKNNKISKKSLKIIIFIMNNKI